MAKISVIIAVYNVEKYLEESLNSIINQTLKDYEVIIINDGSSDKTSLIAKKYVNKYNNFILLENKENMGLPVSRNRGLLRSSGSYIAIHDGDDISLPERFQLESNFLDDNSHIDFIGGHAIKINEVGETIGYLSYPPISTKQAYAVLRNFKLNPIIDPTSMYRRSIIIESGGYSMNSDNKYNSDLELWCRLLTKGSQLYNFQYPLIKYRINPSGITISKEKEIKENDKIIWNQLQTKNFIDPVLRPGFFNQSSFTEYTKESQNG